MKAIFVDGSSFGFMARNMGIQRTNFFLLMEALKGLNPNDKEIYPECAYSLPIHMKGTVLEKNIKTGGFKLLYYEKGGEDQVLIDEIEKSLQVDGISSIILVTCDQDFVPVLRKRRPGVKVTIAATKTITPGGRSMIGGSLSSLFESGEFDFVELSAFADRIASRKISENSTIRFQLLFETNERNPDIHFQMESAMRELVRSFPGSSFRKI